MDDILSDTESVDNVPLSDDTELDDNESLTFSFDKNDKYILNSFGIDTDLEEFIISSIGVGTGGAGGASAPPSLR